MTSRRSLMLLFALLATAAAVAFLYISIDRDVYAPGAGALHRELAQHNIGHKLLHVSQGAERTFDSRHILRKLYSVVAFAIVGFLAAPLLPRDRRLLIDALLVAGFSALIEVAQAVTGVDEGYASNAFDIACGALGGLIGAGVWYPTLRLIRRRT